MSALKDLVDFVFIVMPRSKKPAHKMTDKELLHAVFPKEVVREIKKVARNHRKLRRINHVTKLAH